MENMELYNSVRAVPDEATKTIGAGRLKGMTDINPMWRIQTLTEKFGPCGIGWKYVIKDKHMENGADGTIAAFVDIDLYYMTGDIWSEPIPGTGGASFVSKEKNGPYTSDECYKMALTDALSVACKALGFGADVYWAGGRTKYTNSGGKKNPEEAQKKPGEVIPPADDIPVVCEICGKRVPDFFDGQNIIKADDRAKRSQEMFGKIMCGSCAKKVKR